MEGSSDVARAEPARVTAVELIDRDAGARPVLGFAALLLAVELLALHEIVVRIPGLYVTTAAPEWRVPGGLAALLGLGLGVHAARRAARAEPALFVALLGAAGVLPLVSAAHALALSRGGMPVAAVAGSFAAASLLGAAGAAGVRAFGRPARLLGVVEPALAPHRVLGALVAFVGASIAAALLGAQRAGLALGLLSCVLALWTGSLAEWLGGPPAPRARAWLGASVFVALLVALGVRELALPAASQLGYANEIVWGVREGEHQLIVTSGQRNLELFVDGRLRVSALDQHRYAESLVLPAFAAVERPRKVLIVGGGDGTLEREALAYPSVQKVVVVSDSPVARYARRAPWLRQLSRDSLADARVEVVEAEPIVWLDENEEIWDVIVVDLPEPFGYLEGKNFTVGFYRRVVARLSPGGVAAVQALSAFSSPAASASVARAMEVAGLATLRYRMPITTFGEWSFVLGSREPLRLSAERLAAGRFLDTAELRAALVQPQDTRAQGEVRASTLHEQVVVDLLERRAR